MKFELKQLKSYKGIIGDLQQAVIGLVVLTIIIGVGSLINANVLAQVSTQSGSTSYAYNATNNGLVATYQISTWLQIVVVVVVGAFLIGVVIRYFGGRGMGGGY